MQAAGYAKKYMIEFTNGAHHTSRLYSGSIRIVLLAIPLVTVIIKPEMIINVWPNIIYPPNDRFFTIAANGISKQDITSTLIWINVWKVITHDVFDNNLEYRCSAP